MTHASPAPQDRLSKLDSLVLRHGAHGSFKQGACAMEAVAWLAGEKHSDSPMCTCPVIASFVRRWNDRISDDATRTRLLRPLLPVLLNTRSTREVEEKRMWMAVDWAIRLRTPGLLRMAGLTDLAEQLEQLEQLPEIVSKATCEPARVVVQKVRDAAWKRRDETWAEFQKKAYAASAASAADAADAAYAAYAADAADAADAGKIFAAAKKAKDAGGDYDACYKAARKVADETIGKKIREQFGEVIAAQQASAQDLVRRMCAVTEAA